MPVKRILLPPALVLVLLASSVLSAQVIGNAKEEQIAGAHRAATVLGEIRSRHDNGLTEPKSYFLTHEDLNALLELELAKAQVHGQAEAVESIRIEFLEQNRFTTHMTADMDKVSMSDNSLIFSLFRGLFSGDQKIEVEGELKTANGKGRYSVTRSRINGISVPTSVMQLMLSRLGSQLDPPFDPTESFELRFGIREVEISSGLVTLHTGAVQAGSE